MKWTSIRVRLTLWNVLVLAAMMAGFGGAVGYTLQATESAATDRDLAQRARRFAAGWARFDPGANAFGRAPGGDRPEGTRRPSSPNRLGPSASSNRPGASTPGRPGALPSTRRSDRRGMPAGPSPDPNAARDYRRPHVLTLDGRPIQLFPDNRAWDPDGVPFAAMGREHYSTVVFEGEPLRVLSQPLEHRNQIDGVAQVAYPLGEQQRMFTRLTRTFLTLIPVGLLIAALGGLFLAERALRPVRQVTQAAAQIGAEDLSQRLPVPGAPGARDEMSELAATFNGMIARLDQAFQDLKEAYERQQRFVSDASHELRTPLTAVKANTSMMLSGEWTPEEYREALQAADQAADLMSRIVQDLLLLARSDADQLQMVQKPVVVREVFEQAVSLVCTPGNAPARIEVGDPSLAVGGDAHHLTRLFVNLLRNAVRHTPPDGQITLSARRVGEQVVMQVQDTGEGIPPDHLPHVMERFHRVDTARARQTGGTGLGLAICRSIAKAHGGWLTIESPGPGGRGVLVTVTFPARTPDPYEELMAG